MSNIKNKSQVNPNDYPINPATTSGVDLADILNRTYNTIMSNNAGLNRPLNIERGGLWTQYDAQGNCTLYIFDGVNDVEIGSVINGVIGLPVDLKYVQKSGDTMTGKLTLPTLDSTDTINVPNTFGFKNRIINGAMVIDQRNAGAIFTITPTGGYCLDRWVAYSMGANSSGRQQYDTANAVQYLQLTGATGVTTLGVYQRIESANCYDLANKTVTLSANLANAVAKTATWTVYANTTKDNFSTATQVATGTWSIPASGNLSIDTYSTQINLPLNAQNGIQIAISVPNQTTGAFYLTKVQLELGKQATSFDFRSIGTELQLCNRYYQLYNFYTGIAVLTTQLGVSITHFQPMRATPSIKASPNIQIGNGLENLDQSSAGAGIASNSFNGGQYILPNFTDLTVGAVYQANQSYFTLSAEL